MDLAGDLAGLHLLLLMYENDQLVRLRRLVFFDNLCAIYGWLSSLQICFHLDYTTRRPHSWLAHFASRLDQGTG